MRFPNPRPDDTHASCNSRQSVPKPGDPPERTAPRLVGAEVLAQLLDVEVGYLRRLVTERQIPHFKIGRHVRFDLGDVKGWLEAYRVEVTGTDRTQRNPR